MFEYSELQTRVESGLHLLTHRVIQIWPTGDLHAEAFFLKVIQKLMIWKTFDMKQYFFILGRMPDKIELIPYITIFWLIVHLEKEYSGHHTLWNSLSNKPASWWVAIAWLNVSIIYLHQTQDSLTCQIPIF